MLLIIWSIFALLSSSSSSISTSRTTCKTHPTSGSWPSITDWEALNETVGGRLLKPLPPAAICHSSQPDYNLKQCEATDWTDASTYADSPLGIINPNWSNDSCLPQPRYPCTGEGYPIYVVNASSVEYVAAGVNFARHHNIRLNVKGSGHDYLGR